MSSAFYFLLIPIRLIYSVLIWHVFLDLRKFFRSKASHSIYYFVLPKLWILVLFLACSCFFSFFSIQVIIRTSILLNIALILYIAVLNGWHMTNSSLYSTLSGSENIQHFSKSITDVYVQCSCEMSIILSPSEYDFKGCC